MEADRDGQSTGVILRAFLANLGIAVAKFVAAIITGSSAMLTEGIHSLVDTANQVMLWVGEKRSKRPPDELHPLGYGPELYFWSFIVAILIFSLGAGISIYEGVVHIRHPVETRQPLVAFGVLATAFLLEGWSWRAAYRAFQAGRGPNENLWRAIRNTKDTTSLVVLLEDSAAVLGVVVAAIGIGIELLTGDPRWDGVASIGIGLLLAFVAVTLLREAKGLLIGEAANPALVAAIRRRIDRVDGVIRVEDVLTVHLAPDRVIGIVSVDFANDMEVRRLEELVERIEDDIQSKFAVLEKLYLRPIGGGKPDPVK